MGRKTLNALGALGLYTETPLHCGAESGSGYVDLPIQRERHTNYPVIPGSTLKGVLRDEMAGEGRLTAAEVTSFFGGDSRDEASPGSVAFGDGVLVAFPVRSSQAPFNWVTCPFVLERAFRGAGITAPLPDPPEPGTAWCREPQANRHVLLEETRLETVAHPDFFGGGGESGLSGLLRLLPPDERGFAHTRQVFPERLLVLRDEAFKELVDIGTEILTRIKLTALGTTTNLKEDEHTEITGSDREGNLFVEEVVPPETLFLCPLRGVEGEKRFSAVVEALKVMRIGGDETIGRGLTHLVWLGHTEEES